MFVLKLSGASTASWLPILCKVNWQVNGPLSSWGSRANCPSCPPPLWAGLRINTTMRHSHSFSFPVTRFFYVRLRTYAQYASMNEFTCSEHSVRIRTSKKRSTGNQPLILIVLLTFSQTNSKEWSWGYVCKMMRHMWYLWIALFGREKTLLFYRLKRRHHNCQTSLPWIE